MFHVKPPQGRKFLSLRRFIICSIYYNFTGYFSPLNGLKAISAYSENSAETKQIPSTTRIAVRFEKQIKYRRLKPVNEYTPPHMPKIMRLTRQIPAESLIQKLCAKNCNIMNFTCPALSLSFRVRSVATLLCGGFPLGNRKPSKASGEICFLVFLRLRFLHAGYALGRNDAKAKLFVNSATAHQPLEIRAVQGARAFTTGSLLWRK